MIFAYSNDLSFMKRKSLNDLDSKFLCKLQNTKVLDSNYHPLYTPQSPLNHSGTPEPYKREKGSGKTKRIT